MYPQRLLLLVLLLSLTLGDASAGPWTQKRGHGYYKFGFGFVRANRYYEPNGNRIAIPTLADYTFSLYGEHGFSDRITGVAYLPLLQRLTLNRQVGRETGAEFFEGAETTRIADADLGVRIGLFQIGNTVASASLMAGIPLGDTGHANGLYTGDGEFNQAISLGIGHSFYPAPAYVAVQAGINNRTKGFSDEFRFDAEAGYTIAQKLTFITRLRGLEPLRNGDDETQGGTGGLYGNNQRYLVYAFEMAAALSDHVGVSVSVEGATRGQNILSAPAYRAGVYLRR